MALSEAYESLEAWESESESAEARRPVRRPSSAPSFKPRPSPQQTQNAVTQAQLEAALTRVDGKIKTVSDGVGTVTARVSALSVAQKKEESERKKTTETQGKDLNQKLMMLAILPALIQPSVTTPDITIEKDMLAPNIPPDTRTIKGSTVNASSSTMNLMLPVLAMAGGGFGGSGDSNSGGMDSSMFMMLALVLSLNK